MRQLTLNMRTVLLAVVACVCFVGLAHAGEFADPVLTLHVGDKEISFKRSELLRRADVETVSVAHDPAYHGSATTYKAVRLTALFGQTAVAKDAVVQFKSLDGFSAAIPKEHLLNKAASKSLAYIAIEPADKPWPALKPEGASAGPFYLIWANPKASAIGQEEWPYQLASFEVQASLESQYPQLFPKGAVEASQTEKQGFAVFAKNCFACHTMNKAGDSNMGPDLNVPMNPTEYLHIDAIRKQVRDPQSLRYFPQSRMSAFSKEALSDAELDQLIAYLKYMAKHKVAY